MRRVIHFVALAISRTAAMAALAITLWIGPAGAQTVDPKSWSTDGTVSAIARSGNTIYVGGDFNALHVETGEGVPLDLSNGVAVLPFARVGGNAVAIVYAATPDGLGGWYIGGSFSTVGGLPRAGLAHVLADGSVAPWNPSLNAEVHALAVKGHTVYAGGYHILAAVDAGDGNVAWQFSVGWTVNALAVHGHTVFVGGGFETIDGLARNNLAALDVDTGAPTAWNPGTNYEVMSLAVRGNTVYVGGLFTRIGGQPRNCIAAIDASTGAVSDWNPFAQSSNPGDSQDPPWPWVSALAVSESTVYAGGHFETIGGQARIGVAALDARTGAATTWAPQLTRGYFYAFPAVLAMAVSGSTVYMGGTFSIVGGQRWDNFAAVDAATGAVSPSIVRMDLGVTALAASGTTVYVGGAFRRIDKLRRSIAALDATTGAITPWDAHADGIVDALAVSGRRLYVGGTFRSMGGRSRFSIAALDATTGTALPWDPELYSSRDGAPRVYAIALSGPTVYAAGDFDYVRWFSWQHNIAALDSATARAIAWDPGADGVIRALAVDGQTLYAGGDFTLLGNQPRNYIAALDAATGEATPWDPSASGPVAALALSGNLVYACGDFHEIGGQSRNFVAALDRSSGLATPWNPDADMPVDALATGAGIIYVGGAFGNIGGQPRNHIAALDPVTGAATSWDPNADDRVLALAENGPMLLAGGRFATMGGMPQPNFAVITAAGVAPAVVVGVGWEIARLNALTLFQSQPSPARSRALIRFALQSAQPVSLNVYDLQGRCVETPLDHVLLMPGPHEVPVCTDRWPAGVFLYRLEAGTDALSGKLLIAK